MKKGKGFLKSSLLSLMLLLVSSSAFAAWDKDSTAFYHYSDSDVIDAMYDDNILWLVVETVDTPKNIDFEYHLIKTSSYDKFFVKNMQVHYTTTHDKPCMFIPIKVENLTDYIYVSCKITYGKNVIVKNLKLYKKNFNGRPTSTWGANI